ncbi:MAG: phage protease, partial [Bilophila sp.]
NTRQNGQPAPAAGWIESLGYTAGQGLFARVRWTDNAVAFIEQDEYRYISPVFSFNSQTGAVLELKGAALTNTPALDGLDVVATSEDIGAVLGSHDTPLDAKDTTPSQEGQHPNTETHMDMFKRLKTLLGLPETATEEDVLAEVTRLEALLSPDPKAKDKTEPAPCSLSRKIEDALADGRLTRGLLGWAHDLKKNNPAALMDYLDASVPLVALTSSQSAGRKELFGTPQVSALNDEERFVCEQLGMKEEAYLSQRQAQRHRS